MKKRLYILVVSVMCVLLIFSLIAYLADKIEVVYSVWIGSFIISFIIAFILLLNKLVKLTPMYRLLFANTYMVFNNNPNNRADMVRNYKIVSLGSNNALYAFHFQDILGANWSTGLQTTAESSLIFMKYHSYLQNHGVIILTLCPLGTLSNEGLPPWHRAKYVSFLPEVSARKDTLFVRYPIIMDIKFSLIALLKALLSFPSENPITIGVQMMDKRQLQIDAQRRVDGWKKQFGIIDMESPLSAALLKRQKIVLDRYNELIKFIKERGYKPIFVMPPVTLELSSYFSDTFFENYIYSFTNQFPEIPFLNYFREMEFTDPELYLNSFYLNLQGRKKFTRKVLEDLELINTIQ